MDKDPIPLIAGADMAIFDAAKTFGFCFITLYQIHELDTILNTVFPIDPLNE